MSTVADIPADVLVELTAPMLRAFLALNCEPQCHSCLKSIKVGRKFKLAFIRSPSANCTEFETQPNGYDEMLCYRCTPATLKANIAKRDREMNAFLRRAGGGFTREHKPC